MAAVVPLGTKVFRLTGIPNHLDRLDVTKLLSDFLPEGSTPADIEIASLAPNCDFSSLSVAKTATLTFSRLPVAVQANPHLKEWSFPLRGLAKPLILDDSFYGLTPLNDVPLDQHQYE
jgi:hypothetical protein